MRGREGFQPFWQWRANLRPRKSEVGYLGVGENAHDPVCEKQIYVTHAGFFYRTRVPSARPVPSLRPCTNLRILTVFIDQSVRIVSTIFEGGAMCMLCEEIAKPPRTGSKRVPDVRRRSSCTHTSCNGLLICLTAYAQKRTKFLFLRSD